MTVESGGAAASLRMDPAVLKFLGSFLLEEITASCALAAPKIPHPFLRVRDFGHLHVHPPLLEGSVAVPGSLGRTHTLGVPTGNRDTHSVGASSLQPSPSQPSSGHPSAC